MDMQGLSKGVLTSFKIQKGQWIQNGRWKIFLFCKISLQWKQREVRDAGGPRLKEHQSSFMDRRNGAQKRNEKMEKKISKSTSIEGRFKKILKSSSLQKNWDEGNFLECHVTSKWANDTRGTLLNLFTKMTYFKRNAAESVLLRKNTMELGVFEK